MAKHIRNIEEQDEDQKEDRADDVDQISMGVSEDPKTPGGASYDEGPNNNNNMVRLNFPSGENSHHSLQA